MTNTKFDFRCLPCGIYFLEVLLMGACRGRDLDSFCLLSDENRHFRRYYRPTNDTVNKLSFMSSEKEK